MPEKVIAASLQLDDKQASKKVGSFKQELREANESLIQIQHQFGPTSEQALAAARNVAELRDRMQEAREVTELYDPGARFKAFGNVLRTVAGGMTALTGTMALLGMEGKETEKALLKVQSALAITEGVNTIVDAAKDFDRLKAVALDAFKSIKTAIGSTGIGAILLAVGLLVTYWDDIKEAVSGVSAEQRKGLETAKQLAAKEKEKLDHLGEQDNVLKLNGASEREILKIKEKAVEAAILASEQELKHQQIIQDVQVATAKRNHEILAGLLQLTSGPLRLMVAGIDAIAEKFGKKLNLGSYVDQAIDTVANVLFDPKDVRAKANEANAEAQAGIDKMRDQLAGFKLQEREMNKKAVADERAFQKELSGLKNEAAYLSYKDQAELAKRQLADQYAAQQDEIKASDKTAKQKTQLLLAAQTLYSAKLAKMDQDEKKAAADREKNGLAMLDKLRQENQQSAIKDKYKANEEKIKADADAQRKEIEALKITEDLKLKLLAEADEKKKALLQQNANDQNTSQVDALLKAAQNEQTNSADRLTALESFLAKVRESTYFTEQQKSDFEKAGSETRKQIAQLEVDHKRFLVNASVELLDVSAEMLGKSTAAGKAMALASAAISIYSSAQRAYESQLLPGDPTSVFRATIAAAVAVASGLVRLKQIASVQVPKASVSAPSIPSVGVPAPVISRPQVATTQLPQAQINQLANATVRAYVVESEMSSSQERITRLNRAARLDS